ncbi:hypothetical protein HK104_000869 [Borealophlyctis nickersoniae]|nr:hypothetical protein HK104_000869 [Borealophlyctis nickersoniae]
MESLHRVKGAEPYDILLIDEVEACLKQFSSPTMLSVRGRLLENLLSFERLFNSAPRVVLLDAFISQRTIDFVESMMKERALNGQEGVEVVSVEKTEVASEEGMICSQSDGRQVMREHQQIRNAGMMIVNESRAISADTYQYASRQNWQDTLIQHILAGKRVVIFWGSRSKGQAFEQSLLTRFPNLRIKFYHSESDDALDKDLCNVRDNWKDVDVLMYTAKITVGVNFDTENVFDSLFVYAAAGGCSAREVMQATMRVRHLRDNCMHYYAGEGFTKSDSVPTMNELKSILAKKCRYLDDMSRHSSTITRCLFTEQNCHDILRIIEWGEEKEFMIRLHLQNLLEEEQSKHKFSNVFRNFLKRAGYTCHFASQTTIEGPLDVRDDEKVQVSFGDIPVLDPNQINLFLKRKELTATEKLMLKKYYFVLQFDTVLEDCMDQLWLLWTNPRDRARLENVKLEVLSSPENDFRRKASVIQLKSFTPESTLQYTFIRQLLNILGVNSSIDTDTVISNSVVETLAERMSHLQDPLQTAFKLRERSSIGDCTKRSDKRKALAFVNKVLTAWSNSRLVACKETRKQHRLDGRKHSTYNYKLENKYEVDFTGACGRPYALSDLFML